MTLRKKFGIAVFSIVPFLSGCWAFQPQAVLLKPDVNVQSGDIGSDKSIMLNVIDERTETTLGFRLPGRKSGFLRKGSPIGALLTIEGDIVEIVSDSLSKGLLAQGFQITRSPDEGTAKLKELRVELRSLEYRLLTGGIPYYAKTISKMKGICIVDSLYPYEKLYRGTHEESHYNFTPTDAQINKYVNIALSHAINNLLSDSRLLKCLAN